MSEAEIKRCRPPPDGAGQADAAPLALSQALTGLKPSDLPAPPEAALQIVKLCSQDEFDPKALSALAAGDPVLTAELLRVVNSPFFGLSREIKSIPRAVTVLGQRALRNIVLCIAVRDVLPVEHMAGFDADQFWEDSLRRAVCARSIGSLRGIDAEECFSAGLLQDFGLLVLCYLYPDRCDRWPQFRSLDPQARRSLELETFCATHDQVIDHLAHAWDLPTDLTEALAFHHRFGDPSHHEPDNALAKVLFCADWAASVFSAAEKGEVLERCRAILHDYNGFDRVATESLLEKVPASVAEAGLALGMAVKTQESFDQVIRDANRQLAQDNLSYQELAWRLKKTLHERDALQAELDKEIELAREIQYSLLPRDQDSTLPVVGINVPARKLSGDFYDYFRVADGKILFCLGDVSGKGINASLLMAKTAGLFRCLGKQIHSPARLMSFINTELCENSVRGMFVTMVAGVYDPHDRKIRVTNAGHTPALMVRRDGSIGALDAQTPPLGVDPATVFSEYEVYLDESSFYLYSDGVTEGLAGLDAQSGLKEVMRLLVSLKDLPCRQRLENIVGHFTRSSVPLRDDVTILVLEDGCGGQ